MNSNTLSSKVVQQSSCETNKHAHTYYREKETGGLRRAARFTEVYRWLLDGLVGSQYTPSISLFFPLVTCTLQIFTFSYDPNLDRHFSND